MRFTPLLTDDALLVELGAGLERARLERNLTQAQVAEQAGVSKSTVERLTRQRASTPRTERAAKTAPWRWGDRS